MKRKISFLFLFLCFPVICSAQLKSEVNECFELTSIVFRLAGASEYSQNSIPGYARDIDEYFAKYNTHALIGYTKEIRKTSGIGYDAVSSATALLEIKNGRVVLKKDVDISKIEEMDPRWSEESFTVFVELLQDFYRKTKFRNFYIRHADLYQVATERMDQHLNKLNTDWFESFFGERLQESVVIVSLCNGPSNYAFMGKSVHPRAGIVIGSAADAQGLPLFSASRIYTVIHELCHHFTNKRVDMIYDQIESAARQIYSHVQEQMYGNAYGSAKTTMIEWMNNLFMFMYFRENPLSSTNIQFQIASNQQRGFIWMERSVQFMEYFYNNRDKYATVDDFMPQLIGFVHYTGDNFDRVLQEYHNRRPYVTDIFPMPGSTMPADMDTILVRFSEPMNTSAHSIQPISNDEILPIPGIRVATWKDDSTYLISFDRSELEEGKRYGFTLDRRFFQSQKRYAMEEDFIYFFNTNER